MHTRGLLQLYCLANQIFLFLKQSRRVLLGYCYRYWVLACNALSASLNPMEVRATASVSRLSLYCIGLENIYEYSCFDVEAVIR